MTKNFLFHILKRIRAVPILIRIVVCPSFPVPVLTPATTIKQLFVQPRPKKKFLHSLQKQSTTVGTHYTTTINNCWYTIHNNNQQLLVHSTQQQSTTAGTQPPATSQVMLTERHRDGETGLQGYKETDESTEIDRERQIETKRKIYTGRQRDKDTERQKKDTHRKRETERRR